jgi:glucokinase
MAGHLEIPFDFPQRVLLKDRSIYVLAGDLGGTKTNLALFRANAEGIELTVESGFHSADFSSGTAVLQKFINDHPNQKPDRICSGLQAGFQERSS